MADRSITVRLRLQDDFSKPLAKAADATKSFSDTSQQAEKSGGIFDSIKEKISGLVGESGSLKDALAGVAGGFAGGIIGGGIAEGIGGLAESMMGAVGAASDLNETVNKSQAIFGAQAGSVEQWANSAATSFGLSKGEALDYASALGDMFTQLGNSGAESAKMSEKVVKLAADLGSFNNLDTGDVLERIQAGFRGEYDSLQQLVPNINAARVQTEALAETGKKNASQLTAQEKATATLNIITKDTSRAQGDFAKTAHQAANQQKINAAQMKDLQAKIGQGLLPAYKAFLNLVGNVGIPALNHLVDAGGAVVSAVGPLVGMFKGLPGPVKTAAAAIVAIGLANRVFGSRLSTITSGIGRFGGALRQMSSAQGSIVRTSSGAAVQMGRFGSAIERAGRSAPVIGRMQGAFVNAAAGAEKFPRAAGLAKASMVGLKSAAGGLLNAIGGGFGLALVGVGVVLMAWQKHQADAAAKVQAHRIQVQQLTDAVKEDGNEIGKTTKQTAADILAKNGAFDAAKKYGIGIDTVTQAALGNKRAQDDLNTGILAYTKHSKSNNVALVEMGGKFKEVDASALVWRDTIVGIDSDTQKGLQSARQYSDSVKAAGAAYAGSKESVTPYSIAVKKAADASTKAKAAADDLKKGIDGVNNAFLETQANEDGFEAAIDAATASLKENGKTLDANTEKGRANRSALRDIASSGLSYADSLAKQGASATTVASQINATRQAYSDAAVKMGASRAEADKLAAAFIKMPKQVTTKIKADITAAKANLDAARVAVKDLGVNFDELPKSVQTKLATTGGKDAKKIVSDLGFAVKGVPGELKIKSSTPGADGSMLKLKNLTVTAVTAGGKLVSIKCSTPGQAKALHDILALHGAQISADGKHVTITSSTPLSAVNKKRIDDLKGAAVSADGKRVTIDTSAPGAINAYNQIRNALGAAQSKSLTITTVYKELHVGDNLARHGRGFAANGAVIKPGGHRYMADGGVSGRQAMVAPGGSWITWAEDETGGESYIPHALSKRPRAESILSYTAAQFGFEPLVKRAADGYMSSHMTNWRQALPVQSSQRTVVVQGGGGLSNADRALLQQLPRLVEAGARAGTHAGAKAGIEGKSRADAQSGHLARKRGGGA